MHIEINDFPGLWLSLIFNMLFLILHTTKNNQETFCTIFFLSLSHIFRIYLPDYTALVRYKIQLFNFPDTKIAMQLNRYYDIDNHIFRTMTSFKKTNFNTIKLMS